MAAVEPSYKTSTKKLENAAGESLRNDSGGTAASLGGRRKRRRRKRYQRWRSRKKFLVPEESLTFEVGFVKVWWKEKYWKC